MFEWNSEAYSNAVLWQLTTLVCALVSIIRLQPMLLLCAKPAGEIQVPQGKSGSLCCHTKVAGQEKEVR